MRGHWYRSQLPLGSFSKGGATSQPRRNPGPGFPGVSQRSWDVPTLRPGVPGWCGHCAVVLSLWTLWTLVGNTILHTKHRKGREAPLRAVHTQRHRRWRLANNSDFTSPRGRPAHDQANLVPVGNPGPLSGTLAPISRQVDSKGARHTGARHGGAALHHPSSACPRLLGLVRVFRTNSESKSPAAQLGSVLLGSAQRGGPKPRHPEILITAPAVDGHGSCGQACDTRVFSVFHDCTCVVHATVRKAWMGDKTETAMEDGRQCSRTAYLLRVSSISSSVMNLITEPAIGGL